MNSNQVESPLSAEALELEKHNKAIFAIVEKAAVRSSISSELVEHLQEVQRRGLYQADKDENGNPNFEVYDDYTDWLSDELRSRLKSYSGHTHIKTRYKMINEAVTVVRLAAQEISPLPTSREQVQEVRKCPLERQGKVWARALEIADGRKVLGRFVRQAAREHGTEIAEPGPSASSVLAQVRSEWSVLQPELLAVASGKLLDRVNKFHALFFKQEAVAAPPRIDRSEVETDGHPHQSDAGVASDSPPTPAQEVVLASVNSTQDVDMATMVRPFAIILDGAVCVGFTNSDEYRRYRNVGFSNMNWRKYDYRSATQAWHSQKMPPEQLEAERTDIRTRLRKAAEKLSTQAA